MRRTHVDLVVQRAHEHLRPIRAPTHRRRRTPNLQRRHRLPLPLRSALPHLHRAVVRRARHQLRAGAARDGAVERVHDRAMRAHAAHALARGQVRVAEGVVCAGGVEQRGAERPLEVEDGRFVQVLEEAVVGVWGVRAPEGL